MKQIDLHDPSSSYYYVKKKMYLKYLNIFIMFEKFEIKKVYWFLAQKKMDHEDQSVSSIDQYVHV
jgi:hypothetical protein